MFVRASLRHLAPMKSTLLVLHGAEDNFIKLETIEQIRKSLGAANADWHIAAK